jgi:hypothetical protein
MRRVHLPLLTLLGLGGCRRPDSGAEVGPSAELPPLASPPSPAQASDCPRERQAKVDLPRWRSDLEQAATPEARDRLLTRLKLDPVGEGDGELARPSS